MMKMIYTRTSRLIDQDISIDCADIYRIDIFNCPHEWFHWWSPRQIPIWLIIRSTLHTDVIHIITQYTRTSRKQPTSWTNGIGAVNRTPRRSLIYPVGRAKRPFPQLSSLFSNTALTYNIESTISLNRTKDWTVKKIEGACKVTNVNRKFNG